MDFSGLRELGLDEGRLDLPGFATRVCDRHFGVGGDGLVLVLPPLADGDARMRVFNSDGSEAEMCGNGIRCFALYVYGRGLVCRTKMRVETAAGIILPEIVSSGSTCGLVRVNMGQPVLDRQAIPYWSGRKARGPVLNEALEAGGKIYEATCLSMGNPHCVIFVDDLEQVDIPSVGALIENHPQFPQRVNVEFTVVESRDRLRVAVWERGAGATLACGTGACAAAVAGVLTGRSDRSLKVALPGGELEIQWPTADSPVYMTGPAEEVFRGDLDWEIPVRRG